MGGVEKWRLKLNSVGVEVEAALGNIIRSIQYLFQSLNEGVTNKQAIKIQQSQTHIQHTGWDPTSIFTIFLFARVSTYLFRPNIQVDKSLL